MTPDVLVALLNGVKAGEVHRDRNNRLTFIYDEGWRNDPASFPLSLSMPLAASQHNSQAIEAFIWGLLPDSEVTLERWAKRFQVSPRNAFALISNVGEDCAGAIQFVRPERLRDLASRKAPEIQWLTRTDVADRLRLLKQDHAAWRTARDIGQFSLAGAQPKTALLLWRGRWGVPSGRIPTTHILKPPTQDFDGHAENEHFCLVLARAVGLPAAHSEVQRFDGQDAIVIERYDRITPPKAASPFDVSRAHQEDLCQALGVFPGSKYQSEGGPTPLDIVDLLRSHSGRPAEDVRIFIDALVFNWLVAGTDAHAKNYSLLHGNRANVRLAPLYDMASALPYDNLDQHRLRLAMKVGREYRLRDIGLRQWKRLAVELDDELLVPCARNLASRLLCELPAVAKTMQDDALDHPVLERLFHTLKERVTRCLVELSD